MERAFYLVDFAQFSISEWRNAVVRHQDAQPARAEDWRFALDRAQGRY